MVTGISIHTPHAGRDQHNNTMGSTNWDFNPHAPCGARLCQEAGERVRYYFNPHAPCGARRPLRGVIAIKVLISIHTPHAGRDIIPNQSAFIHKKFQSTRPMRGATRIDVADVAGARHFNPHAPCGARLEYKQGRPRKPQISIHTPHAGRDVPHVGKSGNVLISIHTPHAGRDLHVHNTTIYRELFQSTRPMRGATYTTRAVR